METFGSSATDPVCNNIYYGICWSIHFKYRRTSRLIAFVSPRFEIIVLKRHYVRLSTMASTPGAQILSVQSKFHFFSCRILISAIEMSLYHWELQIKKLLFFTISDYRKLYNYRNQKGESKNCFKLVKYYVHRQKSMKFSLYSEKYMKLFRHIK